MKKKRKLKEIKDLTLQEKRDLKRRQLDSFPEFLELGVRIWNCLNNNNIRSFYDLLAKTEGEVLKFRNFGMQSFRRLTNALKARGFKLSSKSIRVRPEPELEPFSLPSLPKPKYESKPVSTDTSTESKVFLYRVMSICGREIKFFHNIDDAHRCMTAYREGHLDQIHLYPTAENIAYILNDHLQLHRMAQKDIHELRTASKCPPPEIQRYPPWNGNFR